MNTYIPKILIIVIALIPFASPTNLSISWLNVSSDMLKTAWGIGSVLLIITLWIFQGYKDKRLVIYKSKLYLPIIGFIVWCFITLFWVENGFEATIMLAQFTSFFIVFVLVVNLFSKYELINLLLKVLIISMATVSIIGLLQYYLPNNLLIQDFFTQVAIPGSTFGNKNGASHYIVMTLPISLIYILLSKNRKNIFWYSISTFIGFWFISNTNARQAYLAMTIELLFFILFFVLDFYKNNKKSFIKKCILKKNKIISLALIILALMIVSNFDAKGWNNAQSSKIDRYGQISLEDGWARIPGWVNTFEMIKDNPLQGVGIGQWSSEYPRYYDRIKRDIIFNDNVRFARLHNDFLEMLANVGIIGYIFLLWISFLVVKNIITILINPISESRLVALSLSLGLIGFLIVAMFSFPIRLYLPAFLVIIFIGLIEKIQKKNPLNYLVISANKTYTCFMVAIFLLSSFIMYQIFNWIMAEDNYHKSVIFRNIGQNEIAVEYGLKSLNHNNKNPKYNSILGNNLVKIGREEESIQFYKQSINISPFNTIVLLNLAHAYEKINNLDMEHNVLNFILKFDPNNVRASARLVRVLVKKQQSKNATIAYGNMKGNFEYFKGRSGFGPYNDEVARIAIFVKDYKYAKYVYQNAINNYPVAENYINLGMVEFDLLKNKDKGVEAYKKALKLDIDTDLAQKIRKVINKYESRLINNL